MRYRCYCHHPGASPARAGGELSPWPDGFITMPASFTTSGNRKSESRLSDTGVPCNTCGVPQLTAWVCCHGGTCGVCPTAALAVAAAGNGAITRGAFAGGSAGLSASSLAVCCSVLACLCAPHLPRGRPCCGWTPNNLMSICTVSPAIHHPHAVSVAHAHAGCLQHGHQ